MNTIRLSDNYTYKITNYILFYKISCKDRKTYYISIYDFLKTKKKTTEDTYIYNSSEKIFINAIWRAYLLKYCTAKGIYRQ